MSTWFPVKRSEYTWLRHELLGKNYPGSLCVSGYDLNRIDLHNRKMEEPWHLQASREYEVEISEPVACGKQTPRSQWVARSERTFLRYIPGAVRPFLITTQQPHDRKG